MRREPSLRERALRLLARREHSRAELARKLAAHAESREALESLLVELENKRQLSNERYAVERARSLERKYGSTKIRHDLKAKGVDKEIINHISSEGELECARAILKRKYRDPVTNRQERAKRMRFLQGRGFPLDVILKAIQSNHSTSDENDDY